MWGVSRGVRYECRGWGCKYGVYIDVGCEVEYIGLGYECKGV